MAVITQEPLYEIVPAYRPVLYVIHTLVNSLTYQASLELELFVNGAATGSRKRYPPTGTQLQNGQTLHIYEIDIQEELQDSFNNDWPLLNAPAVGGQKSDELLKEFYIKVWDLLPNSDGQLVRSEASLATSQTINVLNAYRDGDKPYHIAENFMAGGYPFIWLTNKPNRQLIGLMDVEILAAIADNVMNIEIITYGFDGLAIDRGIIRSGILINGERTVVQVAIGPANINALQPADFIFGSAGIDEDVKYYTITGGVACANGDFLPTVKSRRYYLADVSCRKYRFVFLNSFGQFETLDVYENAAENYKVESLSYEQSLPLVYDTSDRGQGRQVSWAQRTIKITTRDRTPEELLWFREFAKTVSLFLLSPAGIMTALRMSDGTFNIIDSQRALKNISFAAEYATRDRSQRS